MNKTIRMSLLAFTIISSVQAASFNNGTLTIDKLNDEYNNIKETNISKISFTNGTNAETTNFTMSGGGDFHPLDSFNGSFYNFTINSQGYSSTMFNKEQRSTLWMNYKSSMTVKNDLTVNGDLNNPSNTEEKDLGSKDGIYMENLNATLLVEGNLIGNNTYLVNDKGAKFTVKGNTKLENTFLQNKWGEMTLNTLEGNGSSNSKLENKAGNLNAETISSTTINSKGGTLTSKNINNNSIINSETGGTINVTNEINGSEVNGKGGKLTAGSITNNSTITSTSGTINVTNEINNSTINGTSGNITAGNITNKSTINSKGATIKVNSNIDNSTIEGDSGTLTAGNITNKSTINSKGANITADNITANSIINSESGGNLSVTNNIDNSTIKNNGGTIDVKNDVVGSTIDGTSGTLKVANNIDSSTINSDGATIQVKNVTNNSIINSNTDGNLTISGDVIGSTINSNANGKLSVNNVKDNSTINSKGGTLTTKEVNNSTIISDSGALNINGNTSGNTITHNGGSVILGDATNETTGTNNTININSAGFNINSNLSNGTINTKGSGVANFTKDNTTITGTKIIGDNPSSINVMIGQDKTLTLKNANATNSYFGQTTGSVTGGLTISGGNYENVILGQGGGGATIQKLTITDNANISGDRINADNLTIKKSSVTTSGNISTNTNITIDGSNVDFKHIVVGKPNSTIDITNSNITSNNTTDGGIWSTQSGNKINITNSKLDLVTLKSGSDITIKDNKTDKALMSKTEVTSTQGGVTLDNTDSNAKNINGKNINITNNSNILSGTLKANENVNINNNSNIQSGKIIAESGNITLDSSNTSENANLESKFNNVTYKGKSNIQGNTIAGADIIIESGANVSKGTHKATNIKLNQNGNISGSSELNATNQADIGGNVSGGKITANNTININSGGNVSSGELNANDIYVKSGSNVNGGVFTSTNSINIGELGKDKTNVSGGEFTSNYFKSTNASVSGANINTDGAYFQNSTYNGNSFKSTGNVDIENNSEINSALDIGGDAKISYGSKLNADIINVKNIDIYETNTIINANINASGFLNMYSDATLNADKTIKANSARIGSGNIKGILDIDDSVDLLNANVEKTATIKANNKIQAYWGTINGELESKNSDILLGYGAKSDENAKFITNSGSVILSNKMLMDNAPVTDTQDTNIKGAINANKLLVKDGATLNANSTITTTAEFESKAILGESGVVNANSVTLNDSSTKTNSQINAINDIQVNNGSTIQGGLKAKDITIDNSKTENATINANTITLQNKSVINEGTKLSTNTNGGKIIIDGKDTKVLASIEDTDNLEVRNQATLSGNVNIKSTTTIKDANLSGNLTSNEVNFINSKLDNSKETTIKANKTLLQLAQDMLLEKLNIQNKDANKNNDVRIDGNLKIANSKISNSNINAASIDDTLNLKNVDLANANIGNDTSKRLNDLTLDDVKFTGDTISAKNTNILNTQEAKGINANLIKADEKLSITNSKNIKTNTLNAKNTDISSSSVTLNNGNSSDFSATKQSVVNVLGELFTNKALIDCSTTNDGLIKGTNLVTVQNGSIVNSNINSSGRVDIIGGGSCANNTTTTINKAIETNELVARRGAVINAGSNFNNATIDNATIKGDLTSKNPSGTLLIANGAEVNGGNINVAGNIILSNDAQNLGEHNGISPEPPAANKKTTINSTIKNANDITLGKDTTINADINKANNITATNATLNSSNVNANNLNANNSQIGKDDKSSNIILQGMANIANSVIDATINAIKDIVVTSDDKNNPSKINSKLTSKENITIKGSEPTQVNADLKADKNINVTNATIKDNTNLNANNDINLNNTKSNNIKATSNSGNITISGGEFKGKDAIITANNGKTTLTNNAKVCSSIDTKDLDLNNKASICSDDTTPVTITSTGLSNIDGKNGVNIGKNVTFNANNLDIKNIDDKSKLDAKLNASGEFKVSNSTLKNDISVKGNKACFKPDSTTTLKGKVEVDCLDSNQTTFDGEVIAKNVKDNGSQFNNKTTIDGGTNDLNNSTFNDDLTLKGKGNTKLSNASMKDLVNEAIKVVLDNIKSFNNITNQNGGDLSINNTDKIAGTSIKNNGDKSKLDFNNIGELATKITNDDGGILSLTNVKNVSEDITNNSELNVNNSIINAAIKYDNNKCGTLKTSNGIYNNNVEQCNINANLNNTFNKDILVHNHSEISGNFTANTFKTNTLNADNAFIEITGTKPISSIDDLATNTYDKTSDLKNSTYTIKNSTIRATNTNSNGIGGIRADNLIVDNSHIQAQVVTNTLNANNSKFYIYGGGIDTSLEDKFSGPIIVNKEALGENNEIVLYNTNLSKLINTRVPIAIVNGKKEDNEKDKAYFKVTYKTVLATYNTKVLSFDEIGKDGVWSLGLTDKEPIINKDSIRSNLEIDKEALKGFGKVSADDKDLLTLEYLDPAVTSAIKNIMYTPYYVARYYIDDNDLRFNYLRNDDKNKGFWINSDYGYFETDSNNLKGSRVNVGVDNKVSLKNLDVAYGIKASKAKLKANKALSTDVGITGIGLYASTNFNSGFFVDYDLNLLTLKGNYKSDLAMINTTRYDNLWQAKVKVGQRFGSDYYVEPNVKLIATRYPKVNIDGAVLGIQTEQAAQYTAKAGIKAGAKINDKVGLNTEFAYIKDLNESPSNSANDGMTYYFERVQDRGFEIKFGADYKPSANTNINLDFAKSITNHFNNNYNINLGFSYNF
ncbi:autotransporter adhesin family protein [Campylobacter sp. 2018MI01]|uniref:autotransporter adhesin family protein n=1 Tax=Campylobacter sp. 2018MI01 TaxID=2836735 RepID=UPI001BDA46FB|nr:autotransporter adhesin family protein [Campylobacter sp. 2018MI01]MBT0878316.1 autotransporter adhesin family protein [Campylobacter sp. 2018MI01]